MTRFTPTVVMLQFFALGRVFLEVARMTDGIRFLLAFVYDSAFFVAVFLLAVDNAVFFNCSVNSVERNL